MASPATQTPLWVICLIPRAVLGSSASRWPAKFPCRLGMLTTSPMYVLPPTRFKCLHLHQLPCMGTQGRKAGHLILHLQRRAVRARTSLAHLGSLEVAQVAPPSSLLPCVLNFAHKRQFSSGHMCPHKSHDLQAPNTSNLQLLGLCAWDPRPETCSSP